MSFFIPIINTILGVAGFVVLIVLLISTPWQFKLVLLSIGLVFTQQSLRTIQTDNSKVATANGSTSTPVQSSHPTLDAPAQPSNTSPQAKPATRFIYRGADYLPPTSPETIDEKIVTGKYRGANCQLNVVSPIATQDDAALKNSEQGTSTL